MDPSKFQSLLNSPESATLAGFEVADSVAIAETYCAMSNSDGGQIMVGVRREEAVYGRPDWTAIGILAEEEPGQIIRKLESQIDEKGTSISFDLFALTQGDRTAPERTVLIIIAKKIGNPQNRMSINGGKVFLRRGAQNIAETALDRIERGKSLFRPEQFRTAPASNPETSTESQPFIAPAGVPPQGVADGVYGNVYNWNQETTPESLPKDTLETPSDGLQVPYDAGGGRFPFESHGYGDSVKIGGEAELQSTVNDEGAETASNRANASSDEHNAGTENPELERSAEVLKDEMNEAADSAPRRFIHGMNLQHSREASDSEESLRCEEHSKVLAAFFTSTIDDVCFGLFGHWGRGKTYLINRVSQNLQTNFGYNSIRFSAWKYRTTSEVWAHLYETVATASRASDFMMKLLAPYRSMLARYGIWPIIFSYLAFGFSLYTVNDKLWLGQVALQLLGFTGVAYFLLLFFRLQGFARGHVGTLLKQPSHREKLGLQVAIGDDLRALIMGWVPMDYWLPLAETAPKETRWQRLISALKRVWQLWVALTRNAVPLSAYLLATGFVFIQLAPENSRTLNIPFYGKLDSDLPQVFVNLVYAFWGLFSVVLPGLAFLMWQGPRRLLLVVDDLDRCEPVQMLEIIESVMLLLDDKEIQRRLQIVMLVEEEALYAALLTKYGHLRSKGITDSQFDVATDHRIIRENVEKIFVAYLRLPEIPSKDFSDLLTNYMHASDGEPEPSEVDVTDTFRASVPTANVESSKTSGDPVNSPNSGFVDDQLTNTDEDKADEKTPPKEVAGSPQQSAKSTIEYAKDLKLSGRERRLLQSRLEQFRASERTGIRWGPRTVRCYIHKYRLARALWIALNSDADFDAEALLDALIPLHSTQAGSSDHLIDYIVAQVS